eukprot:SAG31_NODE_4559_length_3137_cov_8.827189_3_plen_125_part_00
MATNFDPELYVANAYDVDVPLNHFFARDGDAVWHKRYKGTFKEEFELHRFPFDIQDFHLVREASSILVAFITRLNFPFGVGTSGRLPPCTSEALLHECSVAVPHDLVFSGQCVAASWRQNHPGN